MVGNGTYAHIGRLPNPGNDAEDMTAALRRLGSDVTTVRDAERGAMTEALQVFTARRAVGRTCPWCSARGTVSRWTA